MRYKRQRGRGGFVRAGWSEAVEMIAAAHVHTIRRHGPDRIAGFTPIPAMSMASYASGTRFLALIGGVILGFYVWYSDLPPASRQVFGDQTDVPESGDWWNAGYLLVWGTNLPTTRTPDAHFMVEERYRGQKVVVVSPDYAEHTKFADHWLAAKPGTDAALAMAMGHVILKEFWLECRVEYFEQYASRCTDLPLLVTLRGADGSHLPTGIGGGSAGLLCLIGFGILTFRRTKIDRIRATTSLADVVVFLLLGGLILLGDGVTLGSNVFGPGYDYRQTPGPWFRSIWVDPPPSLMTSAPIAYQVHAALPWLLYTVWPFSRLAHAWSYPLQYLGRPYILYRNRYAAARR